VAHDRQELVLLAIRVAQRRLGALMLGVVARDDGQAEHAPLGVANRRQADRQRQRFGARESAGERRLLRLARG